MSEWTQTIPLDKPTRSALNGALSGARNKTMLELLGNPREDYADDCREPTNPKVANLLVSRNVGPFKVRGLKPAVDTIEQIFARVKEKEPDIHARLGTAGMLCCRFVRGSTTAISNHSWGTAIDLTIDGVLDTRGDNKVQKGLLQIFKCFNEFDFYWGAAFPTEDAMHFEASDQLMRKWAADGKLGAGVQPPAPQEDTVEFRDRSMSVADIQTKLAQVLHIEIDADGIFGPLTKAAVIQFQSQNGLEADGIVGPKTRAKLAAV